MRASSASRSSCSLPLLTRSRLSRVSLASRRGGTTARGRRSRVRAAATGCGGGFRTGRGAASPGLPSTRRRFTSTTTVFCAAVAEAAAATCPASTVRLRPRGLRHAQGRFSVSLIIVRVLVLQNACAESAEPSPPIACGPGTGGALFTNRSAASLLAIRRKCMPADQSACRHVSRARSAPVGQRRYAPHCRGPMPQTDGAVHRQDLRPASRRDPSSILADPPGLIELALAPSSPASAGV